jgi:hypothetical protein
MSPGRVAGVFHWAVTNGKDRRTPGRASVGGAASAPPYQYRLQGLVADNNFERFQKSSISIAM